MSKKERLIWALVTLGIGFIVFFVSFKDVNLNDVAHQIAHTNYWWLLLGLVLIISYFLLMGKIIQVLVDEKHHLSLGNAIRVSLLEQFGNGVTPMAIGGQPMQMLGLTQAKVPLGEATSVSLMKFIIYQAMIVVTFFISILAGYSYIKEHLNSLMIFVVFGLVIHFFVLAMLIFIMFSPKMTKRLASLLTAPIGWFISKDRLKAMRDSMDEKINEFHVVSRKLFSDRKKLIVASSLTFVQLFIFYTIPYMVIRALGVSHVNFFFVVALNVVLTLAVSIFPIPGGSGGAELGFQVLFSGFITENSVLVLAMLLWRLLTYYFGLFAGIIAYNLVPNDGKKQPKQ